MQQIEDRNHIGEKSRYYPPHKVCSQQIHLECKVPKVFLTESLNVFLPLFLLIFARTLLIEAEDTLRDGWKSFFTSG